MRGKNYSRVWRPEMRHHKENMSYIESVLGNRKTDHTELVEMGSHFLYWIVKKTCILQVFKKKWRSIYSLLCARSTWSILVGTRCEKCVCPLLIYTSLYAFFFKKEEERYPNVWPLVGKTSWKVLHWWILEDGERKKMLRKSFFLNPFPKLRRLRHRPPLLSHFLKSGWGKKGRNFISQKMLVCLRGEKGKKQFECRSTHIVAKGKIEAEYRDKHAGPGSSFLHIMQREEGGI